MPVPSAPPLPIARAPANRRRPRRRLRSRRSWLRGVPDGWIAAYTKRLGLSVARWPPRRRQGRGRQHPDPARVGDGPRVVVVGLGPDDTDPGGPAPGGRGRRDGRPRAGDGGHRSPSHSAPSSRRRRRRSPRARCSAATATARSAPRRPPGGDRVDHRGAPLAGRRVARRVVTGAQAWPVPSSRPASGSTSPPTCSTRSRSPTRPQSWSRTRGIASRCSTSKALARVGTAACWRSAADRPGRRGWSGSATRRAGPRRTWRWSARASRSTPAG